MGKIISLILLLTGLTFGQAELMLFDDGGYQTETKQYIAALITPPSKTRADTLDMFVRMLKDTLGVTDLSTFFDRLVICASPTVEMSLKSLVFPTTTSPSNVGATPFTIDKGYTPAYNKYINSKYNPNVDAVNYSLNSGTIGVYSRTDNTNAGCVIGAWDGTTKRTSMIPTSATGQPTALALNCANTSGTAGTVTNSQGTFFMTRTVSNAIVFYHNGVSTYTSTTSSVGIPNYEFFVGQLNNAGTSSSYDTKQFALYFISKGITSTQARGIHNCIEWFLDAIGAGVIP